MTYEAYRPQEFTMADQASVDERASFIVKTYVHLVGAVLAFIGIEAALLASPLSGMFLQALSTSRFQSLFGPHRGIFALGLCEMAVDCQ